MPSFRLCVAALAVSCAVAGAAALVPVPGPKIPISVAGLEPNRGQAKAEILFLRKGEPSLAVTSQSVLYASRSVRLNLLASNPNPAVTFADPLPGVVNSLTGADPQKWVTGKSEVRNRGFGRDLSRDRRSVRDRDNEELTLKLSFRPGVDPRMVAFEFVGVVGIERNPDGSLRAKLGTTKLDPAMTYARPLAFQETGAGQASRSVSFEVRSATGFGFQLEGRDSSLPLQIEMKLNALPFLTRFEEGLPPVVDAAGGMFVARAIRDAAGKDASSPEDGLAGGSDVAVYKYSDAGALIFVTYLAGRNDETAGFLGIAPDGSVVLAGGTNSVDFPVTPAALQPAYGGPAPTSKTYRVGTRVMGDFFAVRLDPATGLLRASTFLGGPIEDTIGEATLGPDGSLYFLPSSRGRVRAGMPVTRGALQAECAGDPCLSGYTARLSPSLDRLLYGTYLPGTVVATAKLHSDGSVYYAGRAGPGFPTTPTAHQKQAAGIEDGILARLDPQGSSLLFATYIGSPSTGSILKIAVVPDGSVWAAVSSGSVPYRLVRLDSKGERLLSDKPISVIDLAVDREGNLLATGNANVGPDAFLSNRCGAAGYLKLDPNGEQLFATWLPAGTSSEFDGISALGNPLLRSGTGERFEIVEGQFRGVFTGCVLDAASFSGPDRLSPGAIVTLFGSKMGPREGIAFQLQDGRVPTSLGGTRVLVNGEPVPILFASYGQVNVILPYTLPLGTRPKIQVESEGSRGNELASSLVQNSGMSIFHMGPAQRFQAVALNEDGTVNSTSNPAKRGSRVVLFGTGGGATVPPSVAGEVTPLEVRPLEQRVGASVSMSVIPNLIVEYAGAAPGLLAGVTQINVKLPDVNPVVQGFPRSIIPLLVGTGTPFFPGSVTVAVELN